LPGVTDVFLPGFLPKIARARESAELRTKLSRNGGLAFGAMCRLYDVWAGYRRLQRYVEPGVANEVSSSLDNHPTKALPILYDLVHLCRADPSLPVVARSIASLTALGSIKKDSLLS
jgi:hypothetical protein